MVCAKTLVVSIEQPHIVMATDGCTGGTVKTGVVMHKYDIQLDERNLFCVGRLKVRLGVQESWVSWTGFGSDG